MPYAFLFQQICFLISINLDYECWWHSQTCRNACCCARSNAFGSLEAGKSWATATHIFLSWQMCLGPGWAVVLPGIAICLWLPKVARLRVPQVFSTRGREAGVPWAAWAPQAPFQPCFLSWSCAGALSCLDSGRPCLFVCIWNWVFCGRNNTWTARVCTAGGEGATGVTVLLFESW